jgi:hypothetical protein
VVRSVVRARGLAACPCKAVTYSFGTVERSLSPSTGWVELRSVSRLPLICSRGAVRGPSRFWPSCHAGRRSRRAVRSADRADGCRAQAQNPAWAAALRRRSARSQGLCPLWSFVGRPPLSRREIGLAQVWERDGVQVPEQSRPGAVGTAQAPEFIASLPRQTTRRSNNVRAAERARHMSIGSPGNRIP